MTPSSSQDDDTRRQGQDFLGHRLQLRSSPSKKSWIPFIIREPREKDDPIRTPPANIIQMYETTWLREGDKRENRDGSSRSGRTVRTLKFLRPLRSSLKNFKY